jgi:hypothetical protein
MHTTIEDGLVKEALVEALKVAMAARSRSHAFALEPWQAESLMDTCFSVANLVHRGTRVKSVLQVFQGKKSRSTDDLAQLVTTCVTGIREAGGAQTPLVPPHVPHGRRHQGIPSTWALSYLNSCL